MKKKIILILFLLGLVVYANNSNTFLLLKKYITTFSKNVVPTNKALIADLKLKTVSKVFYADISSGNIGTLNPEDQDVAFDNVFHFKINTLPNNLEKAFLEYDLYGFTDASCIVKSINNENSIGGRFFSQNQEWTSQSELLSELSLHKGDNTILFTAPIINNNLYKIKNIRIVFKKINDSNAQFFVSSLKLNKCNDKLYISGVNFPSQTKKVTIGGTVINLKQAQFELVLDANKFSDKISIVSESTFGKIIKSEIKIENFIDSKTIAKTENTASTFSKIIASQNNTIFSVNEFSITFVKGAVAKDLLVSATALRKIDIAPLNASMVNVTQTAAAYRLLPHGSKFKKAAKISLPFDAKAIPEGYTEKDVNVFYFDDQSRLWKEVAKDSLDVKNNIIIAKTNHFTDFLAGIIKMPESPQTSGYTPTSIKDLKAASPLIGVNSINPPSANNRGTANTSFPIGLPKGRSGMQPSLSISYSSDASHSWAGLGWDVSVPSITLDTRWGAPRYDGALETETYTMGGEMMLPTTHREKWVARVADRQFHPRREGGFQKIIRKGSSPSTYYWQVTDKSGVTSYYGGTTLGIDTNSILQTASGNIGYWALTMQVDLKGNTVVYEYDKKQGELYPKKIYYTGFGTEKGKYSVSFIKSGDLSEAPRPDVLVNARLGFKQTNNELLRKIEVRYKDQLVNSYEMTYKLGAFKKTLLQDIAVFDSENNLFYKNKIDYYDDVRDASGNYNPFGEPQTWSVPNDDVKTGFTGIQDFEGNHTLTGSSNGTSKGINYRLGIGPVFAAFKQNTIGGHGGNSWGKSETFVMLEDLDGDQLPDKVFLKDDKVSYRKNLSATGQNGFGEAQNINLSNLGFTKTNSYNWGVDLSIGYGAVGANVGYDKQSSTNKTRSYFMDFNGDGLIDFVDGGQVFYNRLVNGIPTFNPVSTGTPSPVSGDSESSLTQPDVVAILENAKKQNPLHDVVRVWLAPVNGNISLSHTYKLIQNTTSDRTGYLTREGVDKADGVHLYCQINNQLLWDEIIGKDDYLQKSKPNQTFNVRKGDLIYFRVSSIFDGNFDVVEWDPKIIYNQYSDASGTSNINFNLKDPNGKSLQTYDAKSDFFTSINIPSVSEAVGVAKFSGVFKKPQTTDHIKIRLVKTVVPPSGIPVNSTVFEKIYGAKSVLDLDLSTELPLLNLDKNDQIRMECQTKSNIDFQAIILKPTIEVPLPLNSREDKIKPMDLSHTIYTKRDNHYFIVGDSPAISGRLNLAYNINIPVSPNLNKYDGDIYISAKQNGVLVARKNLKVVNRTIFNLADGFDDNYSYPDAVAGVPINIEITTSTQGATDGLLFNGNGSGSNRINLFINNIANPAASWSNDTYDFSIFSPPNTKESQLGIIHRNWGGFIINGTIANSDLIDTSRLQPTPKYDDNEDNVPDTEIRDPNAVPDLNTSDEYFIQMSSSYVKQTVYGLEPTSFIKSEIMSVCRLGEDDISEYIDFSQPTLQGGTTRAFDMITKSKSESISAGASVSGFGGGGSTSHGDSYVVQTMSDFNGDRYPDYVLDGKVEYTNPTGGNSGKISTIGDYSHSENEASGGSASGSYSHGSPSNSLQVNFKKADVKKEAAKADASSSAAKGGNSVSLGGSIGKGKDQSNEIYTDINGDGLADRLTNRQAVQFNTGYGFLPEQFWSDLTTLNKGTSKDFSGNLGYSVLNGSFSGGLNYGRSNSSTENTLMDINADGLADKITYGNDVIVQLNLGDRFDTPIRYPKYDDMTRNSAISYGVNAQVSVQIPLLFISIVPSFGASLGASTSRTESVFSDINGDGYIDYVNSTNEDNLTVRLSTIGRTNMLKGITNAAGNSFTVSYKQLKPSYKDPNAKWVMTEVNLFDGHTGDGVDNSLAKFEYLDGYQDRREREFYGFGKVIQQTINATDNSVYTTSTQEFYNNDFFRKGLLKTSYTTDAAGKKLQETSTDYSLTDVDNQQTVTDNQLLAMGVCDSKRVFVAPIHTQEKTYEGDAFLETNVYNTFDGNGNITDYANNGNGTTDDKVTAKISYYESVNPYYGGIAKQLEVFTKDGLRRKRETKINPTTAEVVEIANYVATDQKAITNFEYDPFGNIKKVTAPANYKNQRATIDVTYDAEVHSNVTEVKDIFGYKNLMEYDYRYGALLKTTDRNDQVMQYTLDAKGRTASIRAPYEIAAGKLYTVAYEYFPEATVPYAKTKNYDPETGQDIVTLTYTDGVGRPLQVKKTASQFTASGATDAAAYIVSGKVIYDAFGRAIETYYPTYTNAIDNNFSTAVSNITPTKTIYDSKGRAIKVTLPDGSTNKVDFKIDSFGGAPTLLTTQTDALGKISQTHVDVSGKNQASIQNSSTGNLLTQFKINALGETEKVIDAANHQTTSEYDLMGRRTSVTHPDAGKTETKYDLAGNVLERITADLRKTVPNGGAIKYDYDYTRPSRITYPKNPQNNVAYFYGKQELEPSRRGRLWFVQDASGGQEFFYGAMGEITKEIRTLRITPTDVQTYVSQWEYDSWNRLQKMVYPDGETVDYKYNAAGNLLAMQGKKEATTYDYIKQLGYDEFEQRKYLKYGNNTETKYVYDATMRRLQNMTVNNTTRAVMNNNYSYDAVGNVLGITNSAPVVTNTLGGTSKHEYQYDDLYRLTTAKADYKGEFSTASYQLNMSYNNMHNITKKELNHLQNGNQKGYTLNYDYGNTLHPNAPNTIDEVGKPQLKRYVYDDNGNPTSYSEFQSFRKMTWDEENRLQGINDNGRIHLYTYDANGERVIQSSGDSQSVSINGQNAAIIVHTNNYTAYVSPYFVVQKGKFTKHYFEGAGRIVSKLGTGTFAQPIGITAGGVNYIKLTAAQQYAQQQYIKTLGIPPGPPTQQGIYATPAFTGSPNASPVVQEVVQNQEPPEGWPRQPYFNPTGDVPGPPVKYGPPIKPDTVPAGQGFVGAQTPENDIFYFHPDHLGSTSYITSKSGEISEHVEYIAFGEILFEEHTTSVQTPYLFNGKELDRETNMSYFGARYLDMKTSLWLNVDPLAIPNPAMQDQYYGDGQHNGGIFNSRNLNSYGYCYQNPILYVDPNGKQANSSVLLKINQKGYQFTQATTHLLSLVSRVNEKNIANAKVKFSKFGDAGASITLGSSSQKATITHFYSDDKNYNETNGGSFYSFFQRNAHEVGHIPQLKNGNTVHIVTSLLEYGANIADGQDWHEGHNSTKEPEADVGENVFKDFNKFIEKNYGEKKLKKLFENKNNSQKDIIDRIDQWWKQYKKESNDK